MTIIHLSTPQSWRGGEQQVAYLIEELEKSGVDQILITPYGSRLSAYCKSRNITIYHFKRCSALNVQMALLLRKLCKRVQEPILHAHDANAHTAAFLSHLFFGNRAPLLISRRVDFPIHRSLFSRLKYNHKRIKRIICVSEKIKEIMVPALKDPSVLQVIYSGIDLNRFDDCHNRNLLRKEFKIPADHTLVANVAAIVPHKDYYTFVDTAAHVLKVHPKTTFLIIGEGEEREQITAYIHEKGLQKSVLLTGFRHDITQILPEIEVFLITSQTEGLGTAILDAFACGIPVVATRAGGIPEIVNDQRTGLLAEVKDANALAEKVLRFIHDRELKAQIVARAKEEIRNFTRQQTARITMETYEEITKESY
ncbi:MAG: hypothetical protein CSA95_09425 [Bacteroidetes bacterium]|nr:MAG: hypothetical protein CSA95_09425 [Bacteroidota bacterium]